MTMISLACQFRLWSSRISITWDLVSTESQLPAQTFWIRICILTSSLVDLCTHSRVKIPEHPINLLYLSADLLSFVVPSGQGHLSRLTSWEINDLNPLLQLWGSKVRSHTEPSQTRDNELDLRNRLLYVSRWYCAPSHCVTPYRCL